MKNRKNSPKKLPASVAEMATISITGNIVPPQWFKTITFDNGKPDLNSILILADICYWYRPSEIRCERSGAVIGQKKKFAEDMLRKSYSDLQTQFGLSDRQLRDCFSRLEKRGVIRRIFRTLESSTGRQNNVMYIELFPSIVKELTHKNSQKSFEATLSDPINMDCPPYHDRTGQGVTSNVTPITIERDTYPVITGGHIETNTTSNISSNISSLSESDFPNDPLVKAFFAPKKKEREKDSISKKMLAIWNELVPEKTLSSANKFLGKQLEAALRDQLDGNLEDWKTVCKNFKSSKFLMGEVDSIRIKPDLSWLVDPKEPRVRRVFEKQHYTFDDRSSSSKQIIDLDKLEEEIEELPEVTISKQVRLFVFQQNPAFDQSFLRKAILVPQENIFFIGANSHFARDKIAEAFEAILKDFLHHKYNMTLKITGPKK